MLEESAVSFEDTRIAFASKSDKELNRAYWLFRLINFNFLVKVGPTFVNAALAIKLPIKGLIKSTVFAHFCGGETIEDCNTTIKELWNYKVGTILDYSVEGEASEAAFDECVRETISTIERAKNDPAIPFSVFKITGLARFSLLEKIDAGEELTTVESVEYERVLNRIDKICKAAYDANVPIFIDAEESWIQKPIDAAAERMMELYNKEKAIVYNTIQLYRKDRLSYLKSAFERASEKKYLLGVKLVRGAYMEKERARAEKLGYSSPIQNTKEDTDKDYNHALEFCIKNIDKIAICAGTHNEDSTRLLIDLMIKNNISSDNKHIFFSQLLGMSDHLSFNLSHAGYNVAKYVPYGPVTSVLPYLFRRAQENTSISGQMGRELSLIIKEKQRRKKA